VDEVEVTDMAVPGGGRLRTFTTGDDWAISVFRDVRGRVQLALRRTASDSAEVVAHLTPAEGVALAALLTEAKLVVIEDEHRSDSSD
jgi:hypothetical protein